MKFAWFQVDDKLEAYKAAYDIVMVEEECWDVIDVFLAHLFKKGS